PRPRSYRRRGGADGGGVGEGAAPGRLEDRAVLERACADRLCRRASPARREEHRHLAIVGARSRVVLGANVVALLPPGGARRGRNSGRGRVMNAVRPKAPSTNRGHADLAIARVHAGCSTIGIMIVVMVM